jgi:hypothetical protein
MKVLLLKSLCVLMVSVWAASCSSPEMQPVDEYCRLLEAADARDLVYMGAVPFARQPLVVGQWAEYLVVDGDKGPMRVRLSVVGKEGDTFRLHSRMELPTGPTDTEFLVKASRDSSARDVEFPAAPGQESTAPEDASSFGSKNFIGFLAESIRTKVSADRPLEITVPPGTFENTVKRRLTVEAPTSAFLHEWLNGKVPIGGVVKAETEDGAFRQVLMDFYTAGIVGAPK